MSVEDIGAGSCQVDEANTDVLQDGCSAGGGYVGAVHARSIRC